MESREVEPGARLRTQAPRGSEATDVTGLEAIAILRPASARPRDLLGIDRHRVSPSDQHGGGGSPAAHAGDLRDERHLPVEVDGISGRERIIDRRGHRCTEAQRVAAIRQAVFLDGVAEEADLRVTCGASAAQRTEHAQWTAMHGPTREASHPRQEAGDVTGEPFAGGLGAIVDPHGCSLTSRVGVRVEVDRDERIGACSASRRAARIEPECAIRVTREDRAMPERREVIRSNARDEERDILLARTAGSHHAGTARTFQAALAAVPRINDDGSHRPLRAPRAR